MTNRKLTAVLCRLGETGGRVMAPVSWAPAARVIAAAGCSLTVKVFSSLLFVSAACGGTYYVDCAAGNDAADGQSPATAWRSVRAVSAREFHAGDSIRLRRGTTCHGTLWPKGSGVPAAPILLDAWGDGPLPKVQAEPGAEAAFRLFNQEYWTVQHAEFIGGQPHGVFVSGTEGVLHAIHIRSILVHGVTGEPKNKEGGLVVVASGSAGQRFDDVLIDGVTAYGTSQWAGILVGSLAFGFLSEPARSSNVSVRNSIVHDVAGDGIVLFQVNQGRIESSVAWYTGMQRTQSIGTPNAIWTWMCHECAVRRCEAFLTDSPGVDGGGFDIDYGDDDNVVEDSYAHDTQGYCVAVFGAGRTTTNSIVRRNVCAANGRSPRLAAMQGAVFLSTWDGGRLRGVQLSENRILWNPPIAAAAVVNTADFDGEGAFADNLIESSVPQPIRSTPSLRFARNSIRIRPDPPLAPASFPEIPALPLRNSESEPVSLVRPAQWRLYAFVPLSGDEVVLVASAYRQFHAAGLDTVLIAEGGGDREGSRNLRRDWNLGDLNLLFDNGEAARLLNLSGLPALILVNAAGQIVWRHDGFTPPGNLGLALRAHLGNPDYAQLISEP
jgi:hypothetical protein